MRRVSPEPCDPYLQKIDRLGKTRWTTIYRPFHRISPSAWFACTTFFHTSVATRSFCDDLFTVIVLERNVDLEGLEDGNFLKYEHDHDSMDFGTRSFRHCLLERKHEMLRFEIRTSSLLYRVGLVSLIIACSLRSDNLFGSLDDVSSKFWDDLQMWRDATAEHNIWSWLQPAFHTINPSYLQNIQSSNLFSDANCQR